MKRKLATIMTSFIAAFLMIFSTILAPLAPVFADAPGNNGTLKVHELGTPKYSDPVNGTENNDPKVCAFNFEGFGFDVGQTGYVIIEGQGQTNGTYGNYSFGPTTADPDHTSFAETIYFNNPTPLIPDGHYKATLYGKDTGNPALPDLDDEKAKSKVFKVECIEEVAPAEVTFDDLCGTASDTFTIPSTTGVLYQISGITQTSGTKPGTGTVTVNAVAATGYTLTGTTMWTYTFTDRACPPNVIQIPAQPDVTDPCGTGNATWNVPQDTNDLNWELDQNGNLTVTIITPNTQFPNSTTSHNFGLAVETNTNTCPPNIIDIPAEPSVTDPCGAGNATWNVPQDTSVLNWELDQNGHLILTIIPANTVFTDNTTSHDFGVAVETNSAACPTDEGGQVLGASTTVTPTPQVLGASTLVNTGNSSVANLFVGLFIISSTIMLSGYSRKNSLNI